jgi:hypothetical protein
MSPAQRLDNFARHRHVVALPAWNHDRTRLGQPFQPTVDRHANAVLTPDSSPTQGAGLESIKPGAKLWPGKSEHFSRAGEFKRTQSVINQGDDQRIKSSRARAKNWHDLIE